MKPAAFDYFAPESLDEALTLLDKHSANAKLLAGGQSFVPMANFRVLRPDVVIDLNRIAALGYIRECDGGVAIGAMTRHRAVEKSELVRKRCPLIACAIPNIGHAVIRNRGTVGGSLSHADPAAEWPVVAIALGATMVIRSTQGERLVAAKDFFVGLLSTALAAHEILVEIRFPAAPARTGVEFLEISRRHGDFALVSVGAQVTSSASGAVEDIRLALGGVGSGPLDATAQARRLAGTRPRDADIVALGQGIAEAMEPNDDLHASADYRREVAAVLIARALRAALARAKENA